MAGRPTKLNKRVQNIICRAIRAGMTYERAAEAGGITFQTFTTWRGQGEADLNAGQTTIFSDFFDAVQRAEIDGELKNAEVVFKAAKGGMKITETKTVTKATVTKGEDGKEQRVAGLAEEEVTVVTKTAAPDWKAAAFILERRHGARWGRKAQIDHFVRNLDYSKLSDEQLDRIEAGEDPFEVILSGYTSDSAGDSGEDRAGTTPPGGDEGTG
jgi:hypothetical protein